MIATFFLSDNDPIPLCANDNKCTDKPDGFHCRCLPGFSGKYCENGKKIHEQFSKTGINADRIKACTTQLKFSFQH